MKKFIIVLCLVLVLLLIAVSSCAENDPYALESLYSCTECTVIRKGEIHIRAFSQIMNIGTKPAWSGGFWGYLTHWDPDAQDIKTVYQITEPILGRMVPAVLQPGQTGYAESEFDIKDSSLYNQYMAGNEGFSFIWYSPVGLPAKSKTAEFNVEGKILQKSFGVSESGKKTPVWDVNIDAKNTTGHHIKDPTVVLVFGRDEQTFLSYDAMIFVDYPGIAVSANDFLSATYRFDEIKLPKIVQYLNDSSAQDLLDRCELLDVIVSGTPVD